MERPDKIPLKEAVAEVNRSTIKHRLSRQRKRLRAKYGISKKPKAKRMIVKSATNRVAPVLTLTTEERLMWEREPPPEYLEQEPKQM